MKVAPPATPPRKHVPTLGWLLGVVAVAVALAGYVLIERLLEGPRFVDRIDVVNRATEQIDVDVGPKRVSSTWVPIGSIGPRTRFVARDVVDQGDTWVFRFRYTGRVVGELERTRAALERVGWRIEIPASIVGPAP